jgi:quercetin dioxygenase-like cupin family protein
MKILPVYALVAIALLSGAANSADLYKAPLPPLPPNQQVVIQEIVMAPGRTVPAHRHTAYVYVYIVEGEVDMQLKGRDVVHLKAGQVFTEIPTDVHTVMKNASAEKPAKLIAFVINNADGTGFSLVKQDTGM